MAATMVIVATASDAPESGYKYRPGEVVEILAEDHAYQFMEMPVNPIGRFTVDAVNSQDPASIALYSAIKMDDAGTVTTGDAPVDVAVDDIIVWQRTISPCPTQGNRFTNLGNYTKTYDRHWHVRVTDKTVEEVRQYMEIFNKKLTYTSDQFDPADNMRRFTTTNVRVSASGGNGFTEQGILDAVSTWNTNHPDNTVVINDTDNLTYFQCDGIMPSDLFTEWQDNTQQQALADYYHRRRWYFTQDGMDQIANGDGFLEGTASQIQPYLRDGLLD